MKRGPHHPKLATLLNPHDVHDSAAGSEYLAQQVAAEITKALKTP